MREDGAYIEPGVNTNSGEPNEEDGEDVLSASVRSIMLHERHMIRRTSPLVGVAFS